METSYCAVIRTLGTAGDKYLKELQSLQAQSLQPEKTLVYIAEGYPLPKESIGKEEYLRCSKGMVKQRSLPFNEVDTEWMLLLDDDMYLPPKMVETMIEKAIREKADCIVPDVYALHKENTLHRFLYFLYNSVSSFNNDTWAQVVKKDGSFSFNRNPEKSFLPTQTGAGACILVRKKAYQQIHFEDEQWLDKFRFASQDDQLFLFKLYLYGFKVLMYFDSGIVHLDARAGERPDISKKMFYKKMNNFVVWYRSVYETRKNDAEKLEAKKAFRRRNFWNFFAMLVDALRYRKCNYILDYYRGIRAGKEYVKSEEYKRIPKYI